MYAEIGSDDQDYETFANYAIAHMKEKRSGFKWQRIESGKTAHGEPYFINEYPACESYGQYERAAYIQLPKAVALIVYGAQWEKLSQNRGVLQRRSKASLPSKWFSSSKFARGPVEMMKPNPVTNKSTNPRSCRRLGDFPAQLSVFLLCDRLLFNVS